MKLCINKDIIFKNATTLFSFRNMFRCFKHHHQPLWIYRKDLQNSIYNYSYTMNLFYKFNYSFTVNFFSYIYRLFCKSLLYIHNGWWWCLKHRKIFRKLKSVVVFLKIVVSFVLTRPFGKLIYFEILPKLEPVHW